MMQKAVNTKAKAGLKFSIMVQDSDIYCSRGYCSSNTTSIASKMQTQGTTKKFCLEKSRPKNLKPAKKKTSAPLCSKFIEPKKISYLDKKKDIFWKKSRIGKTLSRQSEITPIPLKVVKRDKTIEAIGNAIITRKKAIFQRTA